MNILKFIESLTDEKFVNGTGSRRESLNQFKKMGSDIALASVPFGLAGVALSSNKTFAQDIGPTPATAIGALQLALTLEYLEDEFYEIGLSTTGLIPGGNSRDLKVFQQISAHENDHVAFLIEGLGGSGSANFVAKPTFNFTAAFPTVFSDYATFLAVAQVLEDTGVRAYKGQAGNLINEKGLLTAALQIHSVEARHASEVRRLRGEKGWIQGNSTSGIGSAVAANYAGEENTNQAGYDTSTLFGANAGTEAFDETLNTQQVVDIANIFIV